MTKESKLKESSKEDIVYTYCCECKEFIPIDQSHCEVEPIGPFVLHKYYCLGGCEKDD